MSSAHYGLYLMEGNVKRLLVLIIGLLLLIGQMVAAQDGYQITTSAPEGGMYPLLTSCNQTVYDASRGGLTATVVPVTVDAYVIWKVPARPAEYYVSFTVNGIRNWTIYGRATLDAICPKAAAQSLVKKGK